MLMVSSQMLFRDLKAEIAQRQQVMFPEHPAVSVVRVDKSPNYRVPEDLVCISVVQMV
jgi:hypothetical protein